MSASGKTTNGAFPPSSSWTRFTVWLAASMILRPVAVSPVSETMSTAGLRVSSSPTSAPGPVTTFSAPAGSPASWKARPSSRLVSGVQLAGATALEHPPRAGIERKVVGAERQVGVRRLLDRLSLVPALELRELGESLGQKLGDLQEHFG